MMRLLLVVCFFTLSLAQRGVRDYGYDPCEGRFVGNGYYNLAGEESYNRRAELVCDFGTSRTYDRVMDIAWIMLDGSDSCRRATPIPGNIEVDTQRSKSSLTISDYDSRDHGVYRCFGTVDSGRYNDVRRSSRQQERVVYMDVAFRPSESRGRYRSSRYLY